MVPLAEKSLSVTQATEEPAAMSINVNRKETLIFRAGFSLSRWISGNADNAVIRRPPG